MIPSEVFLSSLKDCRGLSLTEFIDAHAKDAVVSIRANGSKFAYASASIGTSLLTASDGIFAEENFAGNVPWCENAFYLTRRPSFTLDPLVHTGAYYVQEASSMFIHYALSVILGEQRDLKALDLCASPGGKTTLLASLPHFRLVLANEIIQSRVQALYENVVKWGAPHLFISNNDPEDFNALQDFFDVALIDAPCSGSGLFRKDSDAAGMWNPELVDFCSSRQKRILTDGTKALTENGVLVYSTCSYSIEENEQNLDFLMREGEYESIQVSVDKRWGIVETESPVHHAYGYRFYPDKLNGEGFFCAFLRKKTGCYFTSPEVSQKKVVEPHFDFINPWVNPSKELSYSTHDKDVFVVDAINKEDVQLLQRILNIRKSGARIGSLLRNDIIPDHELAMSSLYSSEIRKVELNKEQALKYLRKDDFSYDISELGWILATYKGIPMGWIKVLSGRVNNYYPMKWRILMRK